MPFGPLTLPCVQYASLEGVVGHARDRALVLEAQWNCPTLACLEPVTALQEREHLYSCPGVRTCYVVGQVQVDLGWKIKAWKGSRILAVPVLLIPSLTFFWSTSLLTSASSSAPCSAHHLHWLIFAGPYWEAVGGRTQSLPDFGSQANLYGVSPFVSAIKHAVLPEHN